MTKSNVAFSLFWLSLYYASATAAAATTRSTATADGATTTTTTSTIVLESFENPQHEWVQMNDPVMGGKSTGTFTIRQADGVALFEGHVVDVPFLHAPGFIQARTVDSNPYPDISSCEAIQLTLKSNVDYSGYRFSFGNAHAPGGKMFAYGYKVTLEQVPVNEFATLTLPLQNFTDFWDDATGDPIRPCRVEDSPNYCPDPKTLQNVRRLTIWAEGVAGTISLELKSIAATGCTGKNGDDSSNNSNGSGLIRKLEHGVLRGWNHQQGSLSTLVVEKLWNTRQQEQK